MARGAVEAIVTEPVDAEPVGLTVLFFSGGSDRRVGPNRMWVDQARCWAARGAVAVRLDPPGVGESDGDHRFWDQLKAHYDPIHVGETIDLLNGLVERGLPDRFVLVGFCSGGFRSLQVALRDRRVAGVVAIGLTLLRWSWWTVRRPSCC